MGAIEAELGVAVLRIMTSNERPVLDVAEDVLRAYRGAWAGDGAAVMELPKNVEGDCAAQATALVQSDGPPQPTPELGRSLDSLNFLLSGLTSDAIDVLACSNARVSTPHCTFLTQFSRCDLTYLLTFTACDSYKLILRIIYILI